MIPGIHMNDVSEFQGHPGWSTYAAKRVAAICRVGYGELHEDLDWAFDEAGVQLLPWRGYYHYLVAQQDPGAQARQCVAWINQVGGMKAGDALWLDLEEGGGDQRARATTYMSITDQAFGITTGLYSYDYFFKAHLGDETDWPGRPIWLAAYQNKEPIPHHDLWQHTNGHDGDTSCQPPPGLPPCDCSVFHGTVQQLLALPCTVGHGTSTVTPTQGGNMIAATHTGQGYWCVKPDGSVDARGDAVYYGGCNPGAPQVTNKPGQPDVQGPPGGLLPAGHVIVGITAFPTATLDGEQGYWLKSDHGEVYAFGVCQHFGNAS